MDASVLETPEGASSPLLHPEARRNLQVWRRETLSLKVAVVTWLAIKETWFLIKISVVSAEVPLLLSWPALAELGMQYDIAKGVANFARLNVQQVCLINSASGHPQVSVIGARPAHMTWPERVDWSLTEVYEPAAQEACMASSREELFFPKKVPNSVHDMLVNDEAFLSWWR